MKKLSIRAAKELLVRRIVEQAQIDGVDLSEVERKMLYFTESGQSLPEMAEVSAIFDRDFDQAEYEAKITSLVRNILSDKSPENEEKLVAWRDAVLLLSNEDHYLLVLISDIKDSNSFITFERPAVRPPHDRLKLFVTAAALVFLMMVIAAILGPLCR
jgi:hypothetical protein